MRNMFFKKLLIGLMCLDAIFLTYFLILICLTLSNILILNNFHIILFLIVISVNIAFMVYVVISLILNKKRATKRKHICLENKL